METTHIGQYICSRWSIIYSYGRRTIHTSCVYVTIQVAYLLLFIFLVIQNLVTGALFFNGKRNIVMTTSREILQDCWWQNTTYSFECDIFRCLCLPVSEINEGFMTAFTVAWCLPGCLTLTKFINRFNLSSRSHVYVSHDRRLTGSNVYFYVRYAWPCINKLGKVCYMIFDFNVSDFIIFLF